VAAVLIAGLLIEWLLVLYTRPARRRLESIQPSGWTARLSALSLRALLDLAALAVFIVAALALFYWLLDRSMGQRVLLAAYLLAVVAVQAVYLILRFLLSPRVSALRLLPLSDAAALYLQRWLMVLAVVTCFGMVTNAVMRLAGVSELVYLQAVTLVTLIIAGLLAAMVLGRREAVASALSQGLAPESLRGRMARRWHQFAILGILLLFVLATLNNVLGIAKGQALLTLLMIPLYFLLDWLLRQVLQAAFGVVEKPEPPAHPAPPQAAAEAGGGDGAQAAGTPQMASKHAPPAVGLELGKMKRVIRNGLRLALAALLFFWVLDIWHLQFEIAEAVARAAFNILVVVLICYVIYCLANAAIQRRLHQEAPAGHNGDEFDAEDEGPGGSRMATLLILLRKFMLVSLVVLASLVVLSSLGVNIGPLIAGAGVVGLAIGFGSQTLVKDIIAGMFFLIDDAFRVGDYVECGSTKGMVEHISVRSLRIRHPRGMVHFIPFGDLSTVTNFSRDYIITKLDFRVRYDTDLDKVRKIVKKKISQVIEADSELGPKLLGKIKSQGVREMDDSAMIMRVKYKTRPGDQFVIRREVYRLMQESFREAGIEFAYRNVTVYIPPEVKQAMSEKDKTDPQKFLQAAAAGAMAAVQADEEEKAKRAKEA
jgi:small-conductance mechanosensitive channel